MKPFFGAQLMTSLRVLCVVLCAGLSLRMVGCTTRTTLRTTSSDGSAVLQPRFTTAVYREIDENTLDVFLSDIPPAQLSRELAATVRGGHGAPGSLVHIHLFLMPRAGRTPIEFTASNTSITQVVLTGSGLGIYAGGGFLLPSTTFDDGVFAGTLRGASMRLVHQRGSFVDRLGSADMTGAIRARRDEALAGQFSDLMLLLLSQRDVQ